LRPIVWVGAKSARSIAELTEDRDASLCGATGRSSAQTAAVRITDPLCDPSWDRLVLSHPGFNFFHRTAWAKVLSRTYGHKPIYLCFSRESESVALVPIMEVSSPFTGRRGVSMPFSDFCRPLLFDGWEQESLTERLLELGRERKWRYFELRGGRDTLPASATVAERYYGHKLDLTIGIEKLFARLPSPVRRALRKAEKSGLTVEVVKTRKAMLDFYQLHVRTRRRHGLPPQSLSFFLNIDEEIIKADLGFVILVKSKTKPVAAAVFFHSGQAALFKFGASDERTHEFRGNNLVMWEGIKQLVGRGLRRLHFGRTSIDNDGLRRFKLSWGAEEEVIDYFRFAFGADMWVNSYRNAPEFHNRLFRRLPLAVNRFAGSLIYPHLD
jgi:Acetyltransferase (GNAT) domain